MIQFQDKGFSLFLHLESKGVFLEQLDGKWVSNAPDELVNKLIDEYNPWGAEKAKKIAEVNAWFSAKVSALTADVAEVEKQSWQTQANEAIGIEPINLLASMAAARGITIEEMIAKVNRKRLMYKAFYGPLQGEKDRVLDLIKALPDAGDYHRLLELWAIKCTG